MNEYIRKLAERSMVSISYRVCQNTFKEIEDPEGPFVREEFSKEKFAELIIQKCIALAIDPQCFPKDHLTLVEAFKSGQEHSVRCIKQHFGVK